MKIEVKAYAAEDTADIVKIWNSVVEDGQAFPQTELLNIDTGKSYAVKKNMRGKHIGEVLVCHCMKKGQEQGFTQLGVIPNGFLLKNGEYEDIIPHYIEL